MVTFPTLSLAKPATCALNGVEFIGMSDRQQSVLKEVGGSCAIIEGEVNVNIDYFVNQGGFCRIGFGVENNSQFNFATFGLKLVAYDRNDYLIGDVIVDYASLRPKGKKNGNTGLLSGVRCGEVETFEVDYWEYSKLASGELFNLSSSHNDLLRRIVSITNVKLLHPATLKLVGGLGGN